MKNYMILLLLLGMTSTVIAQNTTKEVSDPAAKAVLEKMKNIYESYSTIEANFSLVIEIPDQDPETQKGVISQKGDKYHLQIDNQVIISDGNTLWYHLKNKNEVQINNVEEDPEDEEIMSPKQLLRIYESDQFLYALTNEGVEKGVAIQQIEFKPIDRDSDYSKLRLTVNKKDKSIMRIKAFGKDGSRFTLSINKFNPNKTMNDQFFVFDETKYKGIRVEDLRID